MGTSFDVIVVGGGLAGLAAGATAALGGASTVVLEAHQPGGRSKTTEADGFVFNHGIHALYVDGPGMAVLDSLGIRPAGRAPALNTFKVLAGGEQHVMPSSDETIRATTFLGPREKAQLGELLRLIATAEPHQQAGRSVGDWLGQHDVGVKVDMLARAFFRLTTYASDLDQLGADAGIAQVQLAARSGVIYLDGGWSQLVDALRGKAAVRSGVAVRAVASDDGTIAVTSDAGTLTARAVILATGLPGTVRALLDSDPGWADLGEPITAACLDVGVARVPTPGYVVAVDQPLYGTTQSPPARQAPDGRAVVGAIRYGARTAREDRPQLERHLREVGVADEDVVVSRFLARMVVTGAMPRGDNGGLPGRPAVTATGLPGVFIAGDWVGPVGLLADAALASGQAAARAALRSIEHAAVTGRLAP